MKEQLNELKNTELELCKKTVEDLEEKAAGRGGERRCVGPAKPHEVFGP